MKKGFTLIELLAVILILGIIALIAIPTVNNILKESRRGAFQSTLTNLEKAVEEKCTTEQIKNQEITSMYVIENGVITPSLDIKGELPDGIIYVTQNCEVSFNLSDNNFTGTKEVGEEIVIVDKGDNTSVTVYKEELLNGTDPVITGGLIPVTISDDGTVKKADITKKWYSYEEKMWANAVILTDTGKVESNGTIKEESIDSYFVWIPRYKYKLFDMGNYSGSAGSSQLTKNPKTVEIVFENKETPVSVGTAVGDYHSHPAFQAFDANGLWVGKFEPSGSTENVTIKPNVTTLTNITLKTIFETAYNYKRDSESHMMKNTEWGAVTYLSLSDYGINKQINTNNNASPKTGYSAVVTVHDAAYNKEYGTDSSVTLPYNTETGYLASTTGNITGIYDMAGGCFEYMAAYKSGDLGESDFESDPATLYGSKYFDVYPSNSLISSHKNRILGDATGELGPFYYYSYAYHNGWWGNDANFVASGYPWVVRGGVMNYGSVSQLYLNSWAGAKGHWDSFRIVLAS